MSSNSLAYRIVSKVKHVSRHKNYIISINKYPFSGFCKVRLEKKNYGGSI